MNRNYNITTCESPVVFPLKNHKEFDFNVERCKELNISEDIDVDIAREKFAIQSSIIRMKFEQMIKRTKELERELRKYDQQVNPSNFYKPPTDMEMPLKKRSKL